MRRFTPLIPGRPMRRRTNVGSSKMLAMLRMTATKGPVVRCERGLTTVEYAILFVLIGAGGLLVWERLADNQRAAMEDGQAELMEALDHATQPADGADRLDPPPLGGGGLLQGVPGRNVAAKQAAKLALALSLTVTRGTANKADQLVVAVELSRLPASELQALEKAGYKIVVVRNSIVEAYPELATKRPRGWPRGKTWADSPGIHDGGRKEVAIATRGGQVPATGNGHNSVNLVIHETAHALDVVHGGSKKKGFKAARTADLAKLSKYEKQAGRGGLEESYAEGMARYYGGTAADRAKTPNLSNYFQRNSH